MNLEIEVCCPMSDDKRPLVETWTLAGQDPAASNVVARIHHLPDQNTYLADVYRCGELLVTLKNRDIESLRSAINGRVGGLVKRG